MIALAETGDPSAAEYPWPAWSPELEVKMMWADDISVQPLNVQAIEFLATHQAAPVELPPEPPRTGPRD